jgi:alpha-1,6-mannosyltransferase
MKNRLLLCLLVGFGGALLALTVCGLLLDIPASTGGPRITRMNELAGLLVVSAVVYFGAVRLILRNAWPCGTVWIVLGVAVALRMLLLTVPPTLSSDIYRYVWDGRVQANGINPYRYIPADPALASLRDAVIYPQINRADYARTIYPPFAQMAFAAVGRIWDSVMGMRLAMLGFEALGIICLLRLLAAGRVAARAHPHLRLESACFVVICQRRPCGCDRDRATGTRPAAAGAAQGRLGGHSTGRRGPRQIIWLL